jgi:hypothetical protein
MESRVACGADDRFAHYPAARQAQNGVAGKDLTESTPSHVKTSEPLENDSFPRIGHISPFIHGGS